MILAVAVAQVLCSGSLKNVCISALVSEGGGARVTTKGWEHLAGVLDMCCTCAENCTGYGRRYDYGMSLEAELTGRGSVQSDADPSLTIFCSKSGAVLTMVYVDEGMVAARTHEEADGLVDLAASILTIRRVGEP
jgi:hypothetical protein